MKQLFRGSARSDLIFDTKETVIELNGVHIEAYPSHHLDAMRGLKDLPFIYIDEADFFPIDEKMATRTYKLLLLYIYNKSSSDLGCMS